MVCEHCYGRGERGSIEWRGVKCCPECRGSGIVSCCDTAGSATRVSVEEDWQKYINGQLAGTTRKDETALYARIVELEKRVGELERK